MSADEITRRDAMRGAAAIALGLTSSATAQTSTSGIGPGFAPKTVSGFVYESRTGGPRQAEDRGVEGVLVSNGSDVAKTDAQGRYTLPIEGEAVIFVIKPSGYAVPVDQVTKLPRFTY